MRTSALLVGMLSLVGCGRSVMVHRPAEPALDQALTRLWTQEIRRVARHGDWLLVRSYAAAGDFVVVMTTGEELSHAAIYDAERDTVIEALMPAVQEIPLEKFVHRNRYVIVVRPDGASELDRHAEVVRARAQIGTRFDIGGMFGVGRADRFYCSELVYWASNTAARDPRTQRLITPAELLDYGEVVYWSGRRDDPQLQRIAAGLVRPGPDRSPGPR